MNDMENLDALLEDVLNETSNESVNSDEENLNELIDEVGTGFALENDANQELLEEIEPEPEPEPEAEAEKIETPEDVDEVLQQAGKAITDLVDRQKKTREHKISETMSVSGDKLAYTAEFKEAIPVNKEYMISLLEKEAEIAQIREEIKELKQEAKVNGASISVANKAIKEFVSQLKEDPKTSAEIEQFKQLIEEDPSLYGYCLAKANLK